MRVLLGTGVPTCARYPLPALFLRKVRHTSITFMRSTPEHPTQLLLSVDSCKCQDYMIFQGEEP
jgi:hypothetical protein